MEGRHEVGIFGMAFLIPLRCPIEKVPPLCGDGVAAVAGFTKSRLTGMCVPGFVLTAYRIGGSLRIIACMDSGLELGAAWHCDGFSRKNSET